MEAKLNVPYSFKSLQTTYCVLYFYQLECATDKFNYCRQNVSARHSGFSSVMSVVFCVPPLRAMTLYYIIVRKSLSLGCLT